MKTNIVICLYLVASSSNPDDLRRLAGCNALAHSFCIMGTCCHDNSLRRIRQLSLKSKASFNKAESVVIVQIWKTNAD